MVVNALSHITMGSVSHVEEEKNELVKDFHRLARLGVRLEDSPNGGLMVHHNSDSSLVVEIKSMQYLDPLLLDLRNSLLVRSTSYSPKGVDAVDRYKGRLCVPDVEDLRNLILEKANGSRYSIHRGATKKVF